MIIQTKLPLRQHTVICLTRRVVSPGSSLICLIKNKLSNIPDFKDLNFLHPCLWVPTTLIMKFGCPPCFNFCCLMMWLSSLLPLNVSQCSLPRSMIIVLVLHMNGLSCSSSCSLISSSHFTLGTHVIHFHIVEWMNGWSILNIFAFKDFFLVGKHQ